MNRMIDDGIIEEIRSRANIVDVIGAVVQLHRAGSGTFKGLCPFHQEKTPSFTVNEPKQVFHCFGCGKGGDVFRFVMERESVDFPNAAHLLAARYNIVIPEREERGMSGVQRSERANARERLYRMNKLFAEYFMNTLRSQPDGPAMRYLESRKIPMDVADRFMIGAAPAGWTDCLAYGRSLGFSEAELIDGGIVRRNEEKQRTYDQFRERLTFSIWNELGQVVGFSARLLDPDAKAAKYVNTPETPVFKKGRLLYALCFARNAIRDMKKAVICEGQLDVIAMHRAGVTCAVAPQGTGFTEEQARMLRRMTEQLVLCFDADKAGRAASLRVLEFLLPMGFDVSMVRIPGGKDPDELFRTQGGEALMNAVEHPIPWLQALCEGQKERFDWTTAAGRGEAAREIIRHLELVENPVTREGYARDAAGMLGVSDEAFFGAMRAAIRSHRSSTGFVARGSRAAENAPAPPIEPPVCAVPSEVFRAELELLELSLAYEDVARHLSEVLTEPFDSADIAGQALNAVLGTVSNGEYAEAPATLREFAEAHPHPELARILVSDCQFAEDTREQVVSSCMVILECHQRDAIREKLRSELRSASAERQLAILAELQKLK